MAQLHYGDSEARRQMADVDPDEQAGINVQGERNGVACDDPKKSANSPPARSSEAPLQVHHERQPPMTSADPLVVPPGVGNFPVTGGYGNLDMPQAESKGSGLPAGVGDEARPVHQKDASSKQESIAKELEDRSASTGGGAIDVHNLKDDYVDLSGEKINRLDADNQPSDDPAGHAETGEFTSQMETPADGPKKEQTSEIGSPVDGSMEQVRQFDEAPQQQESKPCPSNDDSQYGCHSFEGEDGREKVSVESFNVYSGEPEKAVYDATDVKDGQPESRSVGAPDVPPDAGDVDDAKLQNGDPLSKDNEDVDGTDTDVRKASEEGADTNVGNMQEVEMQPQVEEDANDIARELDSRKPDLHELRDDEAPSQSNKGQHQTEEPLGLPREQEDKATIADVKSDDQSGMTQVRNLDQPGLDEGMDMQDRLPASRDMAETPKQPGLDDSMAPEKKFPPSDEDISDVPKQDRGDELLPSRGVPEILNQEREDESKLVEPEVGDKNTGVPLQQDDKATTADKGQPIADVGVGAQEEESPVRSPDMPISDVSVGPFADAGVGVQEETLDQLPEKPVADVGKGAEDDSLSKDMPEDRIPQEREDVGRRAAEQGDGKDTHPLAESEKDMAQGGEQLILNAPVDNFNTTDLPAEQDAELKEDTQNREAGPNAQIASGESPYTDTNCNEDYVKAGYGGEDFVPKNKEEVEKELREPLDEQQERRPTDGHPLDRTMELDDQGKIDDDISVPPPTQTKDVFDRPSALPHPQPADLTGAGNNGNGGGRKDKQAINTTKDSEHDEGHPHKKGVFERIKEKLTPPFHEHHSH